MTKNEPTIHQQNITRTVKEVYKFENDTSPLVTDDKFQVLKKNYNRHF